MGQMLYPMQSSVFMHSVTDVSVSPKESYDFKYINEICCTFFKDGLQVSKT